jgi:hypothetical protein
LSSRLPRERRHVEVINRILRILDGHVEDGQAAGRRVVLEVLNALTNLRDVRQRIDGW